MHHGFQCKNKKQKDFIRHRSTNPQNLRKDEEFLHMTPRTQSIKEKIGKLNFIKIKDFHSLQMTLLKIMKYQDREQVKILTNYIFNKEFISRIYKESLKFKSLKKFINRSVNKHIMEYYSAKKWKELLINVTIWMDLKGLMLREGGQSQKIIQFMVPFL